MGTLSFQHLILILPLTFFFCSADTDKLILKSYDLPYCMVINQNVSMSNCTWGDDGDPDSPKAVRLGQQLITVHTVESSEQVDNTSPEVETNGSFNHTYLFRINRNLCLVMTNSGVIGTGKCTIRKARFVIRTVYINSHQDPSKPEVKTQAYTIEVRSKSRDCVGFPSRNISSLMTKKPCNYHPENVLGQFWTFCNTDGRCNISPKQQSSTTTTSTTPDGDEDTAQQTISTTETETVVSISAGNSYSQFVSPLMILLPSTLVLLLAGGGI